MNTTYEKHVASTQLLIDRGNREIAVQFRDHDGADSDLFEIPREHCARLARGLLAAFEETE